jgi:hypothetical protein
VTEQEPAGLTGSELDALDAWWRAANYLSVGQIYLMGNPLLTEPLRPEHVKPRLLGHWGTTPGLNLIYAHLNRVIRNQDLNLIYICGPARRARDVAQPRCRRVAGSGAMPLTGGWRFRRTVARISLCPPSMSGEEDVPYFAGGVEDQHVPGGRVGPPPAQRGVQVLGPPAPQSPGFRR